MHIYKLVLLPKAETKIYDPRFHYFCHSPEKLADLMAEFKAIQSGYERNLLEHSKRDNRIALVYDEVSFDLSFKITDCSVIYLNFNEVKLRKEFVDGA